MGLKLSVAARFQRGKNRRKEHAGERIDYMQRIISHLNLSARKGLSLLLAVLVCLSVFAGIMVGNGMTSAKAETTGTTAVNAAPNTEVYSTEYFTEGDLAAQFTKWSSGGATVNSDGTITLPGGGNTRATAYMHNTESLDQNASVTFATSATQGGNVILWLRADSYDRGTASDNIVPVGYFVQASMSNGTCVAYLKKAHVKGGTYSISTIGTALDRVDAKASSGEYLDLTVEATATYDETAELTVINVKIYKGTNMMYTYSYEDSDADLQDAGKVGFALEGSGRTVTIRSFAYHTTDSDVSKNVISKGSFSEADLTNDLTYIKANTNISVSNGELVVNGTSSSNYRDASVFVNKDALNANITTVVKTPHVLSDSGTTRYGQTDAVWLRASAYTRPNGETVPIGYFVRVYFNTGNNMAEISVYKQSRNETNLVQEQQIGSTKINVDMLGNGGKTMYDVKIEASISTVDGVTTISVKPYKSTYNPGTITVTDDDPYLQTAGKAGFATRSTTVAGVFKSIAVTASENMAGAYIEENSGKANGAMLAQLVTLEKGETYQLSVLSDTDFTAEPLAVAYKTGNNTANKLKFTPTTDGVVVDSKYKKYTYTFTVGDDAAANSNGWVPAYVGFSMDTAALNKIKFTHFELRRVTDGEVGANLLVNGDFEMGLYAWSDEVADNGSTYYWNTGFAKQDAIKTTRNRFVYYKDSDEESFWTNFMFEGYTDNTRTPNLDNTYYKLTADKELNITFMGGSVVSGHGASNADTTSWRGIATEWFKSTYSDATITATNAAVGSTGSHFALYNFDKVEGDTDLLILGASPNDFYLYNNNIGTDPNPEAEMTYEYALRHVESLIRKAYEKNSNMDIVIVLLFDHWRISDETYLKAYTEVAEKYAIPLVDMRIPLKARAEADGLAWSSDGLKPYRTADDTDAYEQLFLTGDGVHPNDAGYKIYGDYIVGLIEGWLDLDTAPEALVSYTPDKDTLSDTVISTPKVVTANNIPLSEGWTHAKTGFSSIGSVKFGGLYGASNGLVKSSTVGATLTYTFTGTDFGIITRKGTSYGEIYVEVDGVAYRAGDNGNFDDGIIRLNQGNGDHRTQIIMWDAAKKEHTVTIKVVSGTIEIGAYYVNAETLPEGGNTGDDDDEEELTGTRPTVSSENSNLDYKLSAGYSDYKAVADGGKWLTNNKVTVGSDKLTVKAADNIYSSTSLYGEAHTDQVVQLDFKHESTDIAPIVWARALQSVNQNNYSLSGYYAVFCGNGTNGVAVYRRNSDGTDTAIGFAGAHTDSRTFRLEIAVEGTNPTKITVSTYKLGAGLTEGSYSQMTTATFFDDTAELQTPGYAGFSVKDKKTSDNKDSVTVYRFNYMSSDGTAETLSYIEKPSTVNKNDLAGQKVILDPAKTYTLSARVSEANARFAVKYQSASGMTTVSGCIGTVSEVNGYRTVSYTFCLNDWATENGQPAPATPWDYGNKAEVFVGFIPSGDGVYRYSNMTLTEEGSSRNILTNSEMKLGMFGWADSITAKWAYKTGEYGSTAGALGYLALKTGVSQSDYDAIFKVTGNEAADTDYSKINKFMLHLTGKASYTYGKFGQMFDVTPGETYVYSVDFGYDPRNFAEPIAFYHTAKDITPSADVRKTITWLAEQNGSTMTYTFTVPQGAYVYEDTGKAKIFVGITTGETGANCYFANFNLYNKADSSKQNLFVNADFKDGGFKGWIINTNYWLTSNNKALQQDLVAAEQYIRPGNDFELIEYDASKFTMNDGTLAVPDIPDGMDYSSYNGKYMLHIPETVTATYGKIGQIVELKKNTTYNFSMLYKYLRQNSVQPTVMYFTDDPYATNEYIISKGYTTQKGEADKNKYITAIRKVATFDRIYDTDNSLATVTFKVPSDSYVNADGNAPIFVAISTGEYEPIVYFADFSLTAEGSNKNLLVNADFKDGFYGWIVTYGYGIEPVSEKGIYWTSGYTIAQLLPYDETMFVNDTNDHLWSDGDWATAFGADDTVTDTDTDTAVTVEKEKVIVPGKLNVGLTVALFGGIAVAVAAGVVVLIIILKKKRKKEQQA